MHIRNIYRDEADFGALAESYAPLKEHLISSGSRKTINFKKEASQRCLTKALLHRDFQLELDLPSDRLCPPVPNRLNYVLWIQDILRSEPGPSKPVRGIDIGTGASAIYPLLGCRLDPTWSFVATELDERSLQYARANVRANDLDDRIRLVKAETEGAILPLAPDDVECFDFTMCNPPFYASIEDVARSAEGKTMEPNAACTGAPIEMITPGGEGEFVTRVVRESVRHATRCRWYTSMLGMMSSLTHVIRVLKELDITNYAITEFVQGQTRRWAVGWSFTTERLPDAISRISNPTLRTLMPLHTTIRQPISGKPNAAAAGPAPEDLLRTVLSSVRDVRVTQAEQGFLVRAKRDTWSRSARRKQKFTDQMAMEVDAGPNIIQDKEDVALVCRVWLEEKELVYQWTRGEDRGLFDSFCGHVSRKMLTSTGS